jgi:hypothetical protein
MRFGLSRLYVVSLFGLKAESQERPNFLDTEKLAAHPLSGVHP